MHRLTKLEENLKKKSREENKFLRKVYATIIVSILFCFILIFLSTKYPKHQLPLILFVIPILLIDLLLVIKFYSKIEGDYTNKDRLIFNLIQISGRIKNYIEDNSGDKLQLEIAYSSNYLKLKQRINQSLSLYRSVFRIGNIERDFLLSLNDYANSELKEALNGNLNKEYLKIISEKLLDLVEAIFKNNLKSANKIIISNLKKKPHYITELFIDISKFAHLISLLIIFIVIIFILQLFPLKNINDFSTYISLIVTLGLAGIYSKLYPFVRKLLELFLFMFSSSEYEEK